MQAKQAKSNQYTEIDVYPEKVEKKYHSVEKMTSLGVLEKEKEICDKIIEYKKKIGEDYDTWEIKKESADDKIGIVTSTIQDGLWDFEMYKKKIQEQYAWESKLLLFSDKDPTLKEEIKKDNYKEVAIHLDLLESKDISLINEFLFSFLITKFYNYKDSIIYVPKDIDIYIEIPNCLKMIEELLNKID